MFKTSFFRTHSLSPSQKVAVILAALVFMALVLIPGRAAWSFETSSPTNTESASITPFTLAPPPLADGCLPLLHRSTGENPAYAMDQTHRIQDGGAAVSVVLGVRFALGPVLKPHPSRRAQAADDGMTFSAWAVRDDGVGNSQALALSDYRRCRSQQAARD